MGSRSALSAAAQGASGGHNKVKAQSKKSAAVREAEKPEPQKAALRPPAAASCGGISANFKSHSQPSAAVPGCAGLLPALPFPSLGYSSSKEAWAWGTRSNDKQRTAPRLGPLVARKYAILVWRIHSLYPLPVIVPKLQRGANGGREVGAFPRAPTLRRSQYQN